MQHWLLFDVQQCLFRFICVLSWLPNCRGHAIDCRCLQDALFVPMEPNVSCLIYLWSQAWMPTAWFVAPAVLRHAWCACPALQRAQGSVSVCHCRVTNNAHAETFVGRLPEPLSHVLPFASSCGSLRSDCSRGHTHSAHGYSEMRRYSIAILQHIAQSIACL